MTKEAVPRLGRLFLCCNIQMVVGYIFFIDVKKLFKIVLLFSDYSLFLW